MTIKIRSLMALACGAVVFCVSVTHAEVYELEAGGGDLVGHASRVASSYEDTFIEIGRANNLGFEELRIANPDIDPWLPGEGTEVVLPTEFVLPGVERTGIVINVAEYRIYYFYSSDGKDYVATLPASVGRMDWATPVGRTGIIAKAHKPNWYPPESVIQEYAEEGRELARVIPPGPDNPLGDYALRLGLPGYLIHGTNRPAGVGMRVTHGCIRLFPEDIEWLFPRVNLQTPVRIINQVAKFGWRGDELYLEVHPPLETLEDSDGVDMTAITRDFVRVTDSSSATVDWDLVTSVYKSHSGLPVKVGDRVVVNKPAEALGTAQADG